MISWQLHGDIASNYNKITKVFHHNSVHFYYCLMPGAGESSTARKLKETAF
jgi:hypothetical protein